MTHHDTIPQPLSANASQTGSAEAFDRLLAQFRSMAPTEREKGNLFEALVATLKDDLAPMRRAIAFCKDIKTSKRIADEFPPLVKDQLTDLTNDETSDDLVIECRGLKRIREAAEARIAEHEDERLLRGRGGALVPILGTEDPAAALHEAPLEVRRQIIDTLATVTLYPQPRGRKGFDSESVAVEFGDGQSSDPATRATSCAELSVGSGSLVPEDKEL